jgi:hypothetical protein
VRLFEEQSSAAILRGVAAMVIAAALISSPSRAGAQSIPAQTLRSAAAIVTNQGGQRTMLGSAFFVEVPSKLFAGSSFVYLITARHVLLDTAGAPVGKLQVVLEDAKTGASREDPLPDERHWLLDLKHDSADIAVLPYGAPTANIAPIPLSMLFAELNQVKVGEVPDSVEAGAPCFYLTAAALGEPKSRFVPLARFCRVSVADAAEATVTGAGSQALYFVDAPGAPEFSGAPVFAHTEDRYVLFGMMEPRARSDVDAALIGLAGVMPASYIAETVEALAEAQERKARSKSTIGN